MEVHAQDKASRKSRKKSQGAYEKKKEAPLVLFIDQLRYSYSGREQKGYLQHSIIKFHCFYNIHISLFLM